MALIKQITTERSITFQFLIQKRRDNFDRNSQICLIDLCHELGKLYEMVDYAKIESTSEK